MISGGSEKSQREIRDELKGKLRMLEQEEQKLKDEIDIIAGEKKKILSEISKHSDENYEENLLHLVYEQRHKSK